ncbi:MAG: PEGA domain-containing protein [Methylococcales bacterium]|nr:MAG: PEGA domain-containing protein [Methylococcales bacterium]
MKKTVLASLCLLVGLGPVLSGCATIIDGTKQKVSFSSNPSHAEIIVDGKVLGTTPLTQDLSKKTEHSVTLNLSGYHPYEVKLTKKVNSWVWGNLVFGGLIGLGVDALTGGLYELTPSQINADLKVKGYSSNSVVDKTLYVTVTLHPDSSWKKIGNLESL